MPSLYIGGSPAKGGTLWPIIRLLKYFYKVECKTYAGQKNGVYLGHNILPPKVSAKTRRVIFIGGARPADHGIPRKFKWNKVDHIVFISHFFRNIAKSHFKIKRSSVIHLVGGAPADQDLKPVEPFIKEFSSDDEINFVISAKWYKRYFKRLGRHVRLFSDYIRPSYPNAKLHILGRKMEEDCADSGNNIISYRKNFHGDIVAQVYRQSDIQLILTPFDTGPMTVNESLHYRIPFICGNNSAAGEFISMVNGTCGEVVKIDPQIKTARDCKKYKPMWDKKFYGSKLDNDLIMESVNKVISDYSKYVSWQWTNEFNYEAQAKKWMDILFG